MNRPTPTPEADAPEQPARFQSELAVSAYDRVSSTIVALLVLVGAAVLGLLIVVYTARILIAPKPIPVTLEQLSSLPEQIKGADRDLEPPGIETVPEFMEPAIPQTLSSLSTAVSSQEAMLSDRSLDGAPEPGHGKGLGDERATGKGGLVEKIPRAQRWEIRFQGANLDQYARQLDFFGIELAAFGEDNAIHYANQLLQSKPQTRIGKPDAERRLYMSWRGGPLQRADRELLVRAGIAAQDRILVQFYPAQVEQQLLTLEKERAGNRSINDVRKTIFGVKPDGDGYVFYVIDQKYL